MKAGLLFSAIYYEQEIAGHPRVRQMLERFPELSHIGCERYGEIFNRSAQNFRLQKQAPALILAKKHGKLVLPAPAGYGFEAGESFYFSHMLNCLYDCRYCFLQGMFNSAHYVLFVNYEDFGDEIRRVANASRNEIVFYSGYDCDSLAFDPVSKFCDFLLQLFAEIPQATVELRSKSTQIRSLLSHKPLPNCVVAMSFTPAESAQRLELKVPAINKRIEALAKLQQQGWRVGLRIEPVIPGEHGLGQFEELFDSLFSQLDVHELHSVSLGEFRMPRDYFKKTRKLYPDSSLLARETRLENGLLQFVHEDEAGLMQNIEAALLDRIAPRQYYRCES